MKFLFYALLLLVLPFACNTPTPDSSLNFDWLIGNWSRLNEEAPKATFEHWTQESANLYLGFSYTLENADTIWQENVQLIKTNEQWSLNITGQGDSQATTFQLTKIEADGFIAENPTNEFPQRIKYTKNGAQLKAVISAEDMKIGFDFERIK
ncbi:MAG: DUF6265 family protein [Bacteroidota bacterium]